MSSCKRIKAFEGGDASIVDDKQRRVAPQQPSAGICRGSSTLSTSLRLLNDAHIAAPARGPVTVADRPGTTPRDHRTGAPDLHPLEFSNRA